MNTELIQIKISEIGEVITGNTPPTSDRKLYDGNYPLIMPTDIVEGRKYIGETEETVSEIGFQKYQKALLPKNTPCVVTIGSIGKKLCLTKEPSFTNQAINAVKVNHEKFDPTFIFYLFKYNLPQVKNLSSGTASGRENVSKSSFSKIKVILPKSKTIQTKIASVLSAYDDLIVNNNQRIKLLEEVAEEIYREWFVRMRFPAAGDHPGWKEARFYDAEGKEVSHGTKGALPGGWEEIKVGDAFDILGGGTPSTEENKYWNGEIAWFSPTDITGADGIFPSSSKRITELGLVKSSAKLFPPMSVMMTSRATIGAVGINLKEACTNQGFITCLPNNSFPYTYLYQWISLNKPLFENFSSGATFKEISKGVFKKLKIKKPNVSLVQEYHRVSEPIFEELRILQDKNQLLQETRDLLLPRLISGKLSVEHLPVAD